MVAKKIVEKVREENGSKKLARRLKIAKEKMGSRKPDLGNKKSAKKTSLSLPLQALLRNAFFWGKRTTTF